MPYVIAALVLVGAVATLDLLLTLAVLRRLRRQSADLARYSQVLPPLPDPGALVGKPLPRFEATSVDSVLVRGADTAGRAGLIGFFSVGCAPCHEEAPAFARLAAMEPGGRDTVLAVVTGDDPDDGLVAELRGVATVLREGNFGPVASAFQVSAFPTLLRHDGSTVVADSAVGRLGRAPVSA